MAGRFAAHIPLSSYLKWRGYHGRHEAVANTSGYARNGKSSKILKCELGELPIKILRDRQLHSNQLQGNMRPSQFIDIAQAVFLPIIFLGSIIL